MPDEVEHIGHFDPEEQMLLLAKRMPAWKGLLRCCAAAYRAEKSRRELAEKQYDEYWAWSISVKSGGNSEMRDRHAVEWKALG